jgi:hypothetical protein
MHRNSDRQRLVLANMAVAGAAGCLDNQADQHESLAGVALIPQHG